MGLVISMLGILPLLAVSGVIGEGEVEPIGILFGLLFGVVFGGGGGLLLYTGLSNAMLKRLGRTRPFMSGLLRLVWLRASRKTLYAATPDFLIALLILWLLAAPDSFPWLQRSDLRYLVVLEFFAIHSTAILGLIAFTRWTGWGGLASIPQAMLFFGFLGIYVFAAYQVAGVTEAIGFCVLILSKYVSYAVNPLSLKNKGRLALRWLTGLVIFMTVSGFFDIDLEVEDNLVFALTYFLILAVFESFDLMAPSTNDSDPGQK